MENDSSEPRVTFRRRRRRKRPRPLSSSSSRQHEEEDPREEHDESETRLKEIQVRRKPLVRSKDATRHHLLVLLDQRATGRAFRRRECLVPPTGSSQLGMARSIRFSQLRSSSMEAVLALEGSGSYFASLAGTTAQFQLALRFYGVPSPAALEHKANNRTNAAAPCPLLTTIPLMHSSDDGNGNDGGGSLVAITPVQVVMSRDWSVGMAFVHHSLSVDSSSQYDEQQHELLGDLVLFGFSKTDAAADDAIQSFRCPNVRVAGSRAFTMRNLLWETRAIPFGESTPTGLCSKVLNVPGHILLNDEEDGFRLTWVITSGWSAVAESLPPSRLSNEPSRQDIITRTDEVAWEEQWSNRYSGRIATPSPSPRKDLEIAFEAYFSVDALLHDVLSRRKETFGYRDGALPEFHYNLISIDGDGRTMFLVIVFGRTARSATTVLDLSVGVLLKVDILTKRYEEIRWVQNFAPPTSKSLRRWGNVLALNTRMKDQRVGPFCTTRGQDKEMSTCNWSMFYDDSNSSYDQSQDEDMEVWDQYLARFTLKEAAHSRNRAIAPNCVSCVSLFPDCDLISNFAVRLARPVPFIRCRSHTTEFIYG